MARIREIDPIKAAKLNQQGLSCKAIAKVMECSPAGVHAALKSVKGMLLSDDQLQQFQSKQADILDTVSAMYLQELMDVDKIKDTKSRDAAVIVGIATEKSRLIRGQSTANTAVDIRALHALIPVYQSQE